MCCREFRFIYLPAEYWFLFKQMVNLAGWKLQTYISFQLLILILPWFLAIRSFLGPAKQLGRVEMEILCTPSLVAPSFGDVPSPPPHSRYCSATLHPPISHIRTAVCFYLSCSHFSPTGMRVILMKSYRNINFTQHRHFLSRANSSLVLVWYCFFLHAFR